MNRHVSFVPEDLQSLQRELDDLGGGDARIFASEVVALAQLDLESDDCIVAASNGYVHVVDPRKMAARSARRSFAVSHPQFVGDAAQLLRATQRGIHAFLDGFNAATILWGQQSTGKTSAAFGNGGPGLLPYSSSGSSDGLLGLCLGLVFQRRATEAAFEPIVDLQMFEVQNNTVYDLLAINNPERMLDRCSVSNAADCKSLRCESLEQALQCIAVAHSRSVNWTNSNPFEDPLPSSLPGAAHAFAVIALTNAATGRMSTFTIADLVGSRPLHTTLDNRTDPTKSVRASSSADSDASSVRAELLGVGKMFTAVAQQCEAEMERLQTAQRKKTRGKAGPAQVPASAAIQAIGPLPGVREHVVCALLSSLLRGEQALTFVGAVSPQATFYLETTGKFQC